MKPTKPQQKIFTHVWEWFRSHDWKRAVVNKSTDPDAAGMCQYLTAQGHKCAVGCLLSDEVITKVYSASVGSFPTTLMKSNPSVGSGAFPHHAVDYIITEYGEYDMRFLLDLQRTHDQAVDGTLQEAFTTFAAKYSLTIPPDFMQGRDTGDESEYVAGLGH